MDYKLTILGFEGLAHEIASHIEVEYGNDFDASRGDFVVTTENAGGRVVITIRDIALGDAKALAESLYREIKGRGPSGEITINASVAEDGTNNWFPVDLDTDE